MSIFERYIFKNLFVATVLITAVLAAILLLTQSLRFLELIINAGASGQAFWMLTLLALPRFFEIIMPLALMIAVVFLYSRMLAESEITVMRATGVSPLALARPACFLAGVVTVFLWVVTSWLAPVSLSNMHKLRQVIKAQYSSFYLREGVFNNVRPGLTIFIRERDDNGDYLGLLMHDKRDPEAPPVTIMARRGQILTDDVGQKVIVYEGSRQSIDPQTQNLNKLAFDRYTLDLPEESGHVRKRWMEPDERTLWHLFHPDPQDARDANNHWEFLIEAHRRIVSPLLALSFVLLVLPVLLLGPLERRGAYRRIVASVFLVVLIQGLYLGAFNLARQSFAGLYLMYLLVLVPIVVGVFLMSPVSESYRQRLLFVFKPSGGGERT